MPLGRLDRVRLVDEAGPQRVTVDDVWKVMGRSPDRASLVGARTITGRTHQLRVHCTELGFPILGDNIYGSAPRNGGPGLHLLAREIVVPISRNKPPIRATASIPQHMHERLTACGWREEEAVAPVEARAQ